MALKSRKVVVESGAAVAENGLIWRWQLKFGIVVRSRGSRSSVAAGELSAAEGEVVRFVRMIVVSGRAVTLARSLRGGKKCSKYLGSRLRGNKAGDKATASYIIGFDFLMGTCIT